MQTKRLFQALVLVSAALLVPAMTGSAAAAETYSVDTAHTYIIFKVKHLDIGYSYGRFNGPTGEFVFDEANHANSAIKMQVPAGNVDTDVEKRDEHLRSEDFFNAATHELIAFESTRVKPLDGKTFEVTGNLSLLGQSRPIMVTVRDTGAGKDPWGNFRRGFETTFTIKRSDFGMNYMLGGVSDEVEITVSVEGIRK